jgi:hypothetical protein
LSLNELYNAFPDGAGSCAAGSDTVMSSYSPDGILSNDGDGEISDKAFRVLLNGQKLDTDANAEIVVGVDYEIVLTGDDVSTFRGFLIRLDGDANTTEAVSSSHDDAKISREPCD